MLKKLKENLEQVHGKCVVIRKKYALEFGFITGVEWNAGIIQLTLCDSFNSITVKTKVNEEDILNIAELSPDKNMKEEEFLDFIFNAIKEKQL